MKQKISKNMTLGEIAENYPEAIDVLLRYGLNCVGCHIASWETLEEGAAAHGIMDEEFSELLEQLEKLETGADDKTLDLRDIPPFERHNKIFETWNSLNEGESMEVINDHEPKPLYYQFEAEQKGHFEWTYKKQGPKDWIFVIKKLINKDSRKQEIKNLIKQLKTEKDAGRLKEKAKNILKNILPTDLGLIEQEIIREGTTREEMRKLCDIHLEVMGDKLEKADMDIKQGHPIHTLMGEHKIILDFVGKLQEVVEKIEKTKEFANHGELKTLLSISKHLLEADKHHAREEDALFPALKKFGVVEPPMIMEQEHKELKAKKQELHKTIRGYKNFSYREFIKKIKAITEYLGKELSNHISKEDNILYPMAIQVIPKKEWVKIKRECDKIGYCCFTPNRN